MADLVGRTLGNYHIEELLGAGGMGEVYRAMHTRLERPAAIKVLHASQATDATFQARFLREARAAAALSHRNIVEVFDFGEEDGDSYLVMELIPDGSLRTLLRQRSQSEGWTLGLGVDLVRQAAEGLAYAHARGMVHRDIKPDNLLLHQIDVSGIDLSSEPTYKYVLKISDFGLARLVDEGGELTMTGMVMGTPTYMSPEQCQGGDLDGRSDLYSLGVVLYEVATGAPPFRVKSLSEAVFKHISAPPEPPRNIQPDLPPQLEEVILRCLEKRPEDRFATGLELADALNGALGDTELRTIITARRMDGPVTPTPAVSAPAQPGALEPTVADSTPSQPAPTPAAPVRLAVPAQQKASSSEPTVEALVADEPAPPTPARARTAQGNDGARGARVAWGQANDAEATIASNPAGDGNALSAVLKQPRMLASIGGGALALVVLLIVIIAASAHNGAAKNDTHGGLSARATATTLPPTPSPTPIGTVKYQNTLTQYSSQWPHSAHSYFADGGYEINGAWLAFAPVNAVGNGTFSVRTRQLGGPSDQFYGIAFRTHGSGLYYFYGISQDQQWTFSVIRNGNSTPIVKPRMDTHIQSGLNISNRIAVQAVRGHFVFYINGAQVGQADDTSITSAGSVGLINASGDLEVVYDDFKVTVPAQ